MLALGWTVDRTIFEMWLGALSGPQGPLQLL